MNPDRLRQIDSIFQSAIDLPAGQRRRFLDESCANDAELRSEVESLISSHESSGDFIEGSAADVAAGDRRWRDLLFFELLADGFYFAQRGYLALSLDVTDDDLDHFVAAIGAYCDRHRDTRVN